MQYSLHIRISKCMRADKYNALTISKQKEKQKKLKEDDTKSYRNNNVWLQCAASSLTFLSLFFFLCVLSTSFFFSIILCIVSGCTHCTVLFVVADFYFVVAVRNGVHRSNKRIRHREWSWVRPLYNNIYIIHSYIIWYFRTYSIGIWIYIMCTPYFYSKVYHCHLVWPYNVNWRQR